LRKTGDLSATTGDLMRDITHLVTPEQVTVRVESRNAHREAA
jgi:hypothetical protein